MKVDVAHLSLPKVGEVANGDRPYFKRVGDQALLAVIDGLGHGPEAALASSRAVECLDGLPLEASLLEVMQRLHAELRGTRGAAGTVCMLRDNSVEACVVGNVELRSSELRLPLVFSAGVLGTRVAKFHVCRAALPRVARIVLFSDGLSSSTPLEGFRSLAPQATCDAIMQKYRRKEDDATILVADVE